MSDREEQLQLLEASAASGWYSPTDAVQQRQSVKLARTGERVIVTRLSRLGQNWAHRVPARFARTEGSADEYYVGPVVHITTTSHAWPRDRGLAGTSTGMNIVAQSLADSSRRWQSQYNRGVVANQQAAAYRRRKAAAKKAVKDVYPDTTDWGDIDGWLGGDRWADHDDRAVWEAVFWCILHREDLFLHFADDAPPEDGRLTVTNEANQWLATQPLFTGLLRESGRRRLTFAGDALKFIEACVAARRENRDMGAVPDPWVDPDLQQEQEALARELRELGQPRGRQQRWLDLSGDAT